MTLHSRPGRRRGGRSDAFVEQASAEDVEQLHCQIPAGLHRQLRIRAAEEGTTMTKLVVAAIEGYLDRGA